MGATKITIEMALEKLISKYQTRLGHNDSLFLRRIYQQGLDKYTNRIRSIGFINRRVLDAGCGFGQWSLALADQNRRVSACDNSRIRIEFLGDLAKALRVKNLSVDEGSIEYLPYPDNTFDCVFSYSVLYLGDYKKALAEFKRVLRPGGWLYVCTNGLGWYLYTYNTTHNPADDYNPKRIAVDAIANTIGLGYGFEKIDNAHTIVPSQSLSQYLDSLGFDVQFSGAEGSIRINSATSELLPVPFFIGRYEGQEAVYEMLARLNFRPKFGSAG
jgi:ubiquinone/menaquinone biosynthesis C-methylase UbiE